jgi:CRISPR/Cas system-associated protein Cas10 (large subunit of type III CRISPR-Cas system)
LEVVPSKCFGKDWKGAAGEVMAVVAGHDFEELEGGMEKRDYAVLSADGNLMGAFMGTSITLTDMYERSARIDLALKKAFEESALELREALRKTGDNAVGKTLAVLKLGLLYMGGDDTLLLLPSWLAPLVSSSLAEKFLKHMGGARGISIGIAAGPYTSPVWSLIGAARKLQEKAKKKVKEKVEEARGIQSAICFDVSDVVLSETSVRKRRESMENKEKSTVQPFLVDGESNKLRDLLELLLETRGIELCSEAYLASHSEETRKRLKEVRNIIREAVTASRNLFANPSKYAELVNSICKVYLVREMNRSEEGKKPLYRRLLPLFAEEGNSTYGDAELLIKMLGGGTI